MKKLVILVGLVLLCAVGWAGATYVVGGQVESRYLGLLDQYQQSGPFTLSSQGYERGFLGATARTSLEIAVPKGVAGAPDQGVERLQLVFEHRLHHGPLPFGAALMAPALVRGETRLVGVSPGEEDFAQLLAAIPALADSVASFSVAFDGTTRSQVRVPGFVHQLDELRIDWSGFLADSEIGPGGKTLLGSFEMPQLDIQLPAGAISWAGLSGRFDLHETLPLLYVGSSTVESGAIDIDLSDAQSGEQKTVQMKGFEVALDSSFDGKLAGFSQTMTLAGITLDGDTFGPGVCAVEVNNLDGQMLSGFQGQVRDLSLNATDLGPEELLAQLLPLYTRLFEKLVEGSPELNIKQLSFATPLGAVEGKLLVKLAGHPGLALDDPAVLLGYLEADADLSVAQALVDAVMGNSLISELQAAREQGTLPQYSDAEIAALAERQLGTQIEGLLAQNFIVREGRNLRASASFNRGEFVLNGTPLPLFQTR